MPSFSLFKKIMYHQSVLPASCYKSIAKLYPFTFLSSIFKNRILFSLNSEHQQRRESAPIEQTIYNLPTL